MIVHEMEQRSDEWFKIKEGKMSASHAQAIGAAAKGLDTYILEMMAEKYSQAPRESFTNEHIERGNELEPQALSTYELKRDVDVKQVGFVEYSEYVGVSPDGLVGEDGLVEVKCPKDRVYFEYMLYKKVDTKYYWQMQLQMLVTDRTWCDYVVYNPNFKDSILIHRVVADKVSQEKLLIGIDKGIAKIKEIEGVLNAKA